MTYTLLAIDPGKLSGYVVLSVDEDTASILESGEYEQQLTGEKAEQILSTDDTVVVVMEEFIITMETAKKKETRYSLEVIGNVRYFAKKYGRDFHLQTPSAAKSFCDNPRLKALGLYVRGGEGHQRDAMRHAVLWLVKNGWRPENLLEG